MLQLRLSSSSLCERGLNPISILGMPAAKLVLSKAKKRATKIKRKKNDAKGKQHGETFEVKKPMKSTLDKGDEDSAESAHVDASEKKRRGNLPSHLVDEKDEKKKLVKRRKISHQVRFEHKIFTGKC